MRFSSRFVLSARRLLLPGLRADPFNQGVGKTSLLQRYTQNKFDPRNVTSTTGAFFVTKKVYVNGVKVRLQLWDTAGQERFRSMVRFLRLELVIVQMPLVRRAHRRELSPGLDDLNQTI